MSIYPNPASDVANIVVNLQKETHVTVNIFDMQGKEATLFIEKNMQAGEQHIPVNTSDISTGIYFVRVTANEQTNMMKLVIVH